MIRSFVHNCRTSLAVAVAVAVAALALACGPAVEQPGVPLYPNSETTRLPRSEIAQLAGPIAKIDGKDVVGQLGFFDLLPGCHVVELEHHLVANGFVFPHPASFGPFPIVVYALRMKADARYVIRRDATAGGRYAVSRDLLSAREELPNGDAIDLTPARSADDIKACQAWETAALRR